MSLYKKYKLSRGYDIRCSLILPCAPLSQIHTCNQDIKYEDVATLDRVIRSLVLATSGNLVRNYSAKR